MNQTENFDMQIYDIYEIIYTPWWQQWWFLAIFSIVSIVILYFLLRVFKKYRYKKSLPVDFNTYITQELNKMRQEFEDGGEIDIRSTYDRLMHIFQQICAHYYGIDISKKTMADYKHDLRHVNNDMSKLYEFLDTASYARFSNNASKELVMQHCEYIQHFLDESIQNNKAVKNSESHTL